MNNSRINIKDTVAKYSLDYLDCFERPVAIAINYLKPDYDKLYIAYRKLYHSFALKENNGYLLENVYEDEIGIHAHKVEIQDNLTDMLIQLIDKGHPVVVPGDLFALYYSTHFMTDNWMHLFLIKGYDTEKKLFYMLDNIQQQTPDNIPRYFDFPIRFEDLEQIFREYSKNYKSEIYYYETVDSKLTFKDRLMQCVQLFRLAIQEEKYLEIQFTSADILPEEKRTYVDYLMNCPKYRTLAFESLITCLSSYSYNISRLEQLKEQIKKEWITINNVFSLKFLRDKTGNVHYPISDALKKLELDVTNELDNVLAYLANTDSLEVSPYTYENNEDQLISYQNNSYCFHFTNEQVYNTWFSDYAPKVIVYNEKQPLPHFHFQVTCQAFIDHSNEGHQEGIFLRTADNHMFMFALDHLKKLAFDLVGLDNIGYFDLPIPKSSQTTLFVKRTQEQLICGVIDKEQQEHPVSAIPFKELVTQIGFFCKTWNQNTELKYVFTNYKLLTE